MPQPILYAS